jgi:hypothetical protein
MRAWLISLMVLSGCGSQRQDPSVCIPPMTLGEASKLGYDFEAQSKKAQACVARWGIRLSRAEGTLTELSQATVAACEYEILTKAEVFAAEQTRAGSPVSSDDTLARFRKEAQQTAMFQVAMGRAGGCPAP